MRKKDVLGFFLALGILVIDAGIAFIAVNLLLQRVYRLYAAFFA